MARLDEHMDGRSDLIVGGESGSFYLLHRDWVSGVRNLAVCTDVARIR